MNIFICEIAHQYRLDAWYKIFPAGALDDPEGRYGEGGEGGVFRMGNTCTPVVDSCPCIAKPIQYCKVISLQLNKFIFKKKLCIPFLPYTLNHLYL